MTKHISLLLLMGLLVAGCEEPIDDFFTKGMPTEDRCEKLIQSIGIDEAYSTCAKDAQVGNTQAQIILAQNLLAGRLGKDRKEEGLYWLNLAVESHDPTAQILLGKYYIRQNDIGKGIKYIKRAAQNNQLEAQLIMGKLYYKGEYFKQNFDKSRKWFEKAVEQDSPEAKYYLSEIYYAYGTTSEKNKIANNYLQDAAHYGYLPAMIKMGELLQEKGKYNLAASWFAKASKQASAKGQYMLAQLVLEDKISSNIDAIALLEKSSQHYLDAKVALAHCYRDGKGVAKDLKKARQLLENAAELGNAQAFFELGVLMIQGSFGLKQDVPHGIDYLKIAAAKGYQPAKFTLSTLFIDGQPILKDKAEVIKNLAIQAIQDIPSAQYKLAKMLAEFEIPIYDRVAFYWLEKAAKADDIDTHYMLAKFYMNGIGTPTNFEKAIGIFNYLAEKQFAKAYVDLAKIYHRGYGVPANDFIAKSWIKKAITADAPGAKDYARKILEAGFDFEFNEGDSIELLEFAAESDLPSALYTKGQYHLEGKNGYRRSVKVGLKYLHQAADNGYMLAQRYLGMIYENQLYEVSNEKAAFDWYTKAAKVGDEFSQYRLAFLYFHLPDANSKVSAYAWANLAAAKGLLPAEDLRDLIYSELTPEQIEEGQALSLRYLRLYQNQDDIMLNMNQPLESDENVYYN